MMQRYLFPTFSLWSCMVAGAFGGTVISLSKPVDESIKPDVLYWNFDGGKVGESTPNPVSDGSGNGFDGYLLPGNTPRVPTYVEGKFGSAVLLQGDSRTALDPHINWNATDNPGSDESLLDLDGKSFTAGAWVRITYQTPDEEESLTLFERGRSTGNSSYWALTVLRKNNGASFLMLHLPGAFRATPITQIQMDDGEWHHVGISVAPSGGGSRVSFWLDGVLLEGDVEVDAVIPPVEPRDRIFTVGERNVSFHTSGVGVEVDDVFVTQGVHSFEP